MRVMHRIILWLLVLFGCMGPVHISGPAQALASSPSLIATAITVPGISPLAAVVNRRGTRAVLAGVDGKTHRAVFLLYDLTRRMLLHRSVMPAAFGGNEIFGNSSPPHALDERRGRAYFLLESSTLLLHSKTLQISVYCVIDLGSGKLLGVRPLGYAAEPNVDPIVDPDSGALWFVGTGEHGDYLAHTGPLGAAAGGGSFSLDSDADNWSNIWLDLARHRAIVANSDGDFLGFDLPSGRKIFTINSFNSTPTYIAGASRLYDSTTGNLWVVDVSHPAVNVTNVIDGRQRHMALGNGDNLSFDTGVLDPGDSLLFGLLVTPEQEVFALVVNDQSTNLVQLSAAPFGHHIVASYPSAMGASLIQGLTAPASSGLKLDPIVGLPAPGMLAAYYLSCQPGQQVGENVLHIVGASTLSVVDWKVGKVNAQTKLPVTGVLISREAEPLDHGFFEILGTGHYHLKRLSWDGMALLVASGG
jgi:hypothetical protein